MLFNSMARNSTSQRILAAGILTIGAAAGAMAQSTTSSTSFSTPARTREHLQTDPAIYERYRRPGQCTMAARRADRFYTRDHPTDTLTIDPRIDTVPDIVAAVTKACAAQFQINQVPIDQLNDLANAYLYSKQPDLARKTSQRLLTDTRSMSPARRAKLMGQLVETYLTNRPRQMNEIRSILLSMDSLGAPAANERMRAHSLFSQMAAYWDDYPLVITEGEAAVTAWGQMPNNQRTDDVSDMSGVYATLANANRLQSGTTAGVAVAERSKPELLSAFDPSSRHYQMVQSWIEGYTRNYSFYGNPTRAIQSQHWFNTNADTAARPKAGAVTMIFFMTPGCGHSCYAQFASIRRLHEKYGSAGLEIVVVSKTSGHFRSQLTLDPEVEVDLIRKYYLDYLKLPVVLAVPETQFSRMHDGRRMPEQSANEQGWPMGDVLLVDRKGDFYVITSSFAVSSYWMTLERQIQEMLKK